MWLTNKFGLQPVYKLPLAGFNGVTVLEQNFEATGLEKAMLEQIKNFNVPAFPVMVPASAQAKVTRWAKEQKRRNMNCPELWDYAQDAELCSLMQEESHVLLQP